MTTTSPARLPPRRAVVSPSVGDAGGPQPSGVYDAEAHGALCRQCPLRGRHRPVPPLRASGKVRLILVGEAPGRYEVAKGVPFIGPSGLLLNRLLKEEGWTDAMGGVERNHTFVTNALLCRPDSDKELKAGRLYCAPRLAAELKALPADAVIVTMGGPAAKAVLGNGNILKVRGFVWTVPSPKTATKKKPKKEKRHEGAAAK